MAVPSNVNFTSTLPSADAAVNLAVDTSSFPSASVRGSPVSLSKAFPLTVYSLPGTRFRYATVSVTDTSFFASLTLILELSSVAVVCAAGMWIVWPSSLMSLCSATSTSSSVSVSYTTKLFPASPVVSNSNLSFFVPDARPAVKASSCVTGSPSTSSSFPVSLSMSTPLNVYVSPFSRLVYVTVSVITALLSASVR